jgi:methyl-accepting chemotaxis protein
MKRTIPRFLNVPIVWQVALAPLLLLAMTIGVFWWIDRNTERSLTVLADGGQQSLRSVGTIYTASATRLQRVDELVTTIYKVHSDVMRHISLSGSGLSDARLAEIRTEIASGLVRAKQLVADDFAADTAGTNQTRSDPATDTRALLGTYEKAVIEIGDMAELDRLMAIGLLAPTEAKFAVLNRAFLASQEAQRAAAQDGAATVNRQSSETIRDVRAQAAATRSNGWVVAAFALLVGLILSLLIGRGITRPLSSITRAMTRLAGGELAVEIPAAGRKDEVGQMAQALLVFKDHMIEERRLGDEQANERERAAEEKRAALTSMADRIEAETGTALERMRLRTTAMTATADDMASSAGRAGDAATNAAAASAQVMANAQSVAGAAEQLSASIPAACQPDGAVDPGDRPSHCPDSFGDRRFGRSGGADRGDHHRDHRNRRIDCRGGSAARSGDGGDHAQRDRDRAGGNRNDHAEPGGLGGGQRYRPAGRGRARQRNQPERRNAGNAAFHDPRGADVNLRG